jgi:hypothetical protein
MAARRRSMERSRGLGSMLFAVGAVRSGVRGEAGDGAAEGGTSRIGFPVTEAVIGSASAPPASNSKGRGRGLGSGPGFQPSRRRALRMAVSLSPSRPAIHRLLLSLALRRRMVRSRSGIFSGAGARAGGRPGSRARARSPPACKALLVATKSSCRVDEGASNIVLIRISRFEQRHHGVGFCSGIINRIVGKEHAADQNHSLLTLGLEGNAIVDQNGTGRGSRGGQQHWLLRIRMHGA